MAPIRLPNCTGAASQSRKRAGVCIPQAAQRHSCLRCSVAISGCGSGRSNTCRALSPTDIAALSGVRHTRHRPTDNGR